MKYVERNIERGFGQPVILGTRLTVFDALANANNSENIRTFLNEFNLTLEALKSAVSYCKNRICKETVSVADHYCTGCILRSISEGWQSNKDDFIEIDSISISKDGKTFSLGSIEDLDNDEFGIMGWLIAQEVEGKLNKL